MGFRSKTVWLAFGTALFAGQAARAADSVYLGDCARANMIKQQSFVDVLMPHSRYEGITRLHVTTLLGSKCDVDQLQVYSLSERVVSIHFMVYNVTRISINMGKIPGCMVAEQLPQTVSGTVKFSMQQSAKGELCEIYIMSEWKMVSSTDPKYDGSFSNRVISMENGAFVISQPASANGAYRTPFAFTGVNK